MGDDLPKGVGKFYMKTMMTKFLKSFTPKLFNDGLAECILLGQKLIEKKNIERFLDVGCDRGDLTLEFAKIIKPKEVHGVEYVKEYQKIAIKKGIRCIRQDLNEKWSFKSNYFDLILSSQNIEHLHNTRLYLAESLRCLKPKGQLIVLSENLASWVNIASLILGWEPFSSTGINGLSVGNPLHTNEGENPESLKKKNLMLFREYQESGISGLAGHVRVLSYQGLKDLMERIGFKDVKVYTRGYFPFWGKISDLLCILDKRHGHFLIATGFKAAR